MNKLELFTGEILKQNEYGVWEIYVNEDSKVGYPVELIDILNILDTFVKEKFYNKEK